MNKILITGVNGFLGQHLTLYLSAYHKIIATGKGHCRIPRQDVFVYEDVDLVSREKTELMVQKYKPDIIIHNAAVSRPDACENDRSYCRTVNIESTKYLLHHNVAKFIYISTDFVFGESGPHSEEDIPDPLNYYGETKLMAEQEVRESGLPFVMVRPVLMYGKVWEGLPLTLLHWVKNNLEQHKKIKVVSDQKRTPTYVEDICKGILAIIDRNVSGDYHLAGKDIVSPYEMALATARVLNLDESLIENVTSETFPEPVKRAKRSGLKIDKAVRELGYSPVSFEEGVRLTFNNDNRCYT